MSDEKRKRSWRDVDRMKDRGRHRRVERPGFDPNERRTNKSYKAELDRFFEKGVASSRIKEMMASAGDAPVTGATESPERIKLIRKVRSAETFDEFVAAVNDLRKGDGLPNDVDVLTRSLEHPEDDVVQEALSRLLAMTKRLALSDMKAINARLETLENITDNPKTLGLVEDLRAKM